MRNLKQMLIWLKRFRYRCGYGVHSPFAFDFITKVIHEKTPYYAYTNLADIKKENGHSKKINQLLFRLVNRAQPEIIIDAGKPGKTSAYLCAAKKTAGYIPLFSADIATLLSISQVDFLYIDRPEELLFVERLFEYGVAHAESNAMIVIRGIYCSAAMKAFWKRAIADERVGITFDLYDVGILFFDRSRIKQHYIVNF